MIAQAVTSRLVLRPEKRSAEVVAFETKLRTKFVGQEEAVSRFVDVYQTVLAGMSLPGRPISNLLFLGPTGSGKTKLVEAAAEILFGDRRAMVKIDCAEFQAGHEIARLVGSPPGYIGHRETQPMLTQEVLNKWHTENLKLTFVLFDEIEKASDALWQLLLGILDKATLTLGDNRTVDFSDTVVILTSNLGASEMSRALEGRIGFAAPLAEQEALEIERKVNQAGLEAARRKFSPEFMNRLDEVIVFRTLTSKELEMILEIELDEVQDRIRAKKGRHFHFRCSTEAKLFLLREGTDRRYNARELRRAIERHLVVPLSSLMASGQIDPGDFVGVGLEPDVAGLSFIKDEAKPKTKVNVNSGN